MVYLDDGDTGDVSGPARAGGWDPGSSLWVAGVDYLSAWRLAQVTADMFNDAIIAHGLTRADARAVAVSLPDGSASVDIRMSVRGAEAVAGALRRVNRHAA
ncbi:hypothetical protein [Streptomyces sp. SID3343]|uniref:hypothetical protein n=1 Tax=Streptomyces sp. SID3343 TaxID=2690260 RepID=UPI00136C4F83|nr:hypothetical protein [Streptomyces sp. SID3343]MYV98343.1 hypothetical protein [Streptomyces sp. SID3343]